MVEVPCKSDAGLLLVYLLLLSCSSCFPSGEETVLILIP